MRVLLGCDGGGRLGVGHVMRSLALAEAAVAAGHDVVAAGHFEGSFLQAQLAAASVEVTSLPVPMADPDLHGLLDLVRRLRPDVVHIDSYGTPRQVAEMVASAGAEAVVSSVEDGTFGRRPADVVIDPTLGAERMARPQDGTTWLLRGSRYTAVRRRVIEAGRKDRRDVSQEVAGALGTAEPAGPVARSVLVVMGGTDPMGLAPLAVGLLARTGLALEVTAIAVDENARRAHTAAEGSRLSLNVLAPVNDLPALMSGHDLVISAAGTSVWELCCIGVPAAVVWAVDNQREGYDQVVAAGAAIGLGGPGLLADEHALDLLTGALTDSRVRDELVRAGRQVIDGLGAWRVVTMWEQAVAVRSLPEVETAGLVARPATLQDAGRLWQWRNDPATRAGSRSSAEVAWQDHLRWLTASLTRNDRVLLVAGDQDGPVGTVRWDLVPGAGRSQDTSHDWEVSITLAPQRRGHSLARPLLRAAEAALSESLTDVTGSGGSGVSAYLAVVHTGNPSSMRLFETSGYVPDLPPDQQGFMRFRKSCSGSLTAMPKTMESA